MWRRYRWPVLLVLFVATAFAFRSPAEKYFEVAKSLDIFATLFKEVNIYYVDEVDPQKLVRKGIDAMLQSLDPYTDYISEEEMESFRITTTGQYGGVGALIGVVNKKVVVTHPYKNFPAERNGIHVGDEIISVNGQNVQGKTTSQISSLLKGQPKTDVEVRVKRYGQNEELSFKIKREKISVSNIAYYGIVQPDIAYIKLDDFTTGASREVAEALLELKKKGAKSLILDLRENPGGLLHEAINIVSLFIPKGMEVVSTKGKVAEWNKVYRTLNNPIDTEIPMAVLTSEGSASASEIVAGALQDYDRAVLIGQKTFGKGLVQTTRPLSYNSQLKVTTAKYYIPSGRCIQELDYTHRKEDGTVVKVADSLKSEFKTKSGRKVYDGGGLDPDILVDDEFLGTVTIALLNSGLIFDYASKYTVENPATPDFKAFHIDDVEYSKFKSWLKENNFTFTTPLEKSTDDLIESAKQDRYYSDLQKELDVVKAKIENNKVSDLDRFSDQIKRYLEEQIAFHYGLTEGQAQVSLARDKEVHEARKVLADSSSYKKTLVQL
ncbi:S41 family peptidase [Chryseosolibacter indicus]|uniref:S41 family peptidase n=1 Tax=Chryseosolibacter indicus TaxID=2782351 RepID=A0ABS5VYP6_9BACT|nr:S41 family peptidase [Chryseosolibacter indicus]MBT1706049.1 S41 family peptidase [Chryseosolibacter indicus]